MDCYMKHRLTQLAEDEVNASFNIAVQERVTAHVGVDGVLCTILQESLCLTHLVYVPESRRSHMRRGRLYHRKPRWQLLDSGLLGDQVRSHS